MVPVEGHEYRIFNFNINDLNIPLAEFCVVFV